MSGDHPDSLIELGDYALRRGRLEKRNAVVATRREDALPGRPHLRRVGVAGNRDIAESEAQISTHPDDGMSFARITGEPLLPQPENSGGIQDQPNLWFYPIPTSRRSQAASC